MRMVNTLNALFGNEQSRYVALALGTALFLLATGEKLVDSPAYAASVLVVLAATVLTVVNFRLALLLFTAFLFAYEEFNLSSREAFVEQNIENTVLAVRLFGFALMDVVSVLLLLPVIVREWRYALEHGHVRIVRADVYLLPLIIVWVFGGMTGLFSKLSFSAYTWDLRMLGHVLVFYFIYSRTFTTRRDYTIALYVGGAVFLLKQLVFLSRYVTGTGLDMGMYTRVMLGSDLPLVALFLCLSVTVYFLARDHEAVVRRAALMLAAYFTIMLIIGLGKLTYVQTAYCLLLILILHRRDVELRTVVSVLAVAAGAVVLMYYTVLSHDAREMIAYALGRAFNWIDAIMVYGDLSFGTRLLEIINVWAVLTREQACLWGLGWGAPWSEIAIHMPYDGGAFDIEEQYSGVHVQTHIDAVTFMLKVGIIGMLVIYSSMLAFFVKAVMRYRHIRSPIERFTLMGLLLMIIIFVPNYLYFIRLKYLLGFALAGAAIFLDGNDDDRTNTGISDTDHAQ